MLLCSLGLDNIDISDLTNLPTILSPHLKRQIIQAGPKQIDINFPATSGRRFSSFFYTKKMTNGEEIKREWIVYSKKLDAVHCFCCFIFGFLSTNSQFASKEGYKDWKHLTEKIKEHETSAKHMTNYKAWKEMKTAICSEKTIDDQIAIEYQNEKRRLRMVFERIVAFILYLARQNIAFLGTSSRLDNSNNGNFLQLIKAVARFDPVLDEHIRKSGKTHYLSPRTQNELICLIGKKIQQKILNDVLKHKYYSIIVDCTPDMSRKEQMTLIMRYIAFDEEKRIYEIKESFIEFLKILNKSGSGIADAIVNLIEELGLDLDDMRGQGYDNGSNMKGKNIGVQKLILDKNPRALFVPCSAHSLNLMLNDAAAASDQVQFFFSFVQKIFTFFSASTNRWDILTKYFATNESKLKAISTTRWSSRFQ